MLHLDQKLIVAMARAGRTNAEIATAVQCSLRTLDRHRQRDRALNDAIIRARTRIGYVPPNRVPGELPPHGTVSRYNHHRCRCTHCRDAAAARRRQSRATRASQAGQTHGLNVAIEQAIARGERTTQIMRALRVDYRVVVGVRAAMDRWAA